VPSSNELVRALRSLETATVRLERGMRSAGGLGGGGGGGGVGGGGVAAATAASAKKKGPSAVGRLASGAVQLGAVAVASRAVTGALNNPNVGLGQSLGEFASRGAARLGFGGKQTGQGMQRIKAIDTAEGRVSDLAAMAARGGREISQEKLKTLLGREKERALAEVQARDKVRALGSEMITNQGDKKEHGSMGQQLDQVVKAFPEFAKALVSFKKWVDGLPFMGG